MRIISESPSELDITDLKNRIAAIKAKTAPIGARNHACYIKEMLPPELPCMCPHVLGERVRDVAP